MSLAIENLLSLGAIVPCFSTPGQFLSKIFLAPKSNGGKRFILNLKPLNKFIKTEHFKMEDYRTAAKIIPKDGFLATVDLKEAYLLVPLNMHDRKYFRFQFKDEKSQLQTYEFTAMPYGLAVAPRVFSKIMKEVVTSLRSRGFKSVIYLNDILCIGNDLSECTHNVNETIKLLKCLGFVINLEKSCLEPQKVRNFLGFVYNTADLTLSLPLEKRNKISQLVSKFLSLPRCTIREFAQLIGTLIAACPASKYGWMYTKILEREKYLLLQKYGNYDTKVLLPDNIIQDLTWWSYNINSISGPMRTQGYKKEIFSDASLTGWGAYCDGKRANGNWKDSERNLHINQLELIAAFLAIKSFLREEKDCAILLRVDNTTAISYINRMGGIQYPHLSNISRQIWQWCETRNIWLFASYINTRDNKEADEESRRINPDIEWELSTSAFGQITEAFGEPEIDLFASRSNAKSDLYVSWKQDPDAMTVDAFTVDWSNYYFYAFPPFALLLKCIRKIIDDEAEGILVFPYWPSQRSSSNVQATYPGCREALRTAFIQQGTPAASVELMLASLSDNTVKQYGSSLKLWWEFCLTNNIDPFNGSNEAVILFLTEQFNKGARWIKTVLSESGVDASVFKAHSTRHAATSAAGAAGVSVETIRKAAGIFNAVSRPIEIAPIFVALKLTFVKRQPRPTDVYDMAERRRCASRL
ncbi:uncharacterized protein LOC132902730 [Amyelois transitella]|uniref:uncharacterized protein LOC132902730 n=1 Tax=Amyelois transitella TaxID=680683 RepID=UPI002990134F|nr:uncharacterized protein LOC132902730 [Amyelois transitella]